MNKIIINRGSFKLDEVVFQQGTTTIGRATDNMVTLNDNAVSSHHAKIVTLFNTSYIEDLDSTNGTLVNGKSVKKHTLHSGDVVTLGNHQLLFQSDADTNKNAGDDSETLLLHSDEIKQTLSDFMRAQADHEAQQKPGTVANFVPNATPSNQTNNQANNQANSQANNASAAAKPSAPPGAVLQDGPQDKESPRKPATAGNSSLDIEKNQAWLDAKHRSRPGDAIIAGAKNRSETSSVATGAAEKPTYSKSHSGSHSPQASPRPIGGTATVLKTGANNTSGKVNSPATLDSKSTQKIGTDNAAARMAVQNRRSGDPGYDAKDAKLSYAIKNGVMALNRRKPRSSKALPMIWMLIVAVLIVELVYITYRSLA